MAHTFNSSTQEAEAGGSLEFEASLVYMVGSRMIRAISGEDMSSEVHPPGRLKDKACPAVLQA